MKAICISIAMILGTATAAHAAGAFDSTFVTKAGQGGLAEVALGNDASSQGSTDMVKQFGKRMAADHAKANGELKAIASGSGLQVPSAPSAEQTAAEAKLKAMSGPAFDKAYAARMVKDHKDTIALFEKEVKSGQDPKLKTFATETLPTLKDHLQMSEDLKSTLK